jgi:hypothetical protein
MDAPHPFQRFAASTAILASLIAIVSITLLAAALNFDFGASNDLTAALGTGARGAALYRWSMILDMLGYYLLIAPLVLCLWYWLRPRNPARVHLCSLCLLAYVLIGAMGAAILAAVIPPLVLAYDVDAADRETISIVFDATTNMVYAGLWNTLQEFIAGIGWIGIGLVLRHERRAIGILTVALGVAALVDSLAMMLGIALLAELALYLYIVLAPVWSLWLGVDLLRKPAQMDVF